MLRWMSLALLVACDGPDSDPVDSPQDSGVHNLLPAAQTEVAWLGVAASAPDAVWFVGGQLDPPAAAVARYDDRLWLESAPGPHLWWVFSLGPQHTWACGAGGRVLRRQVGATWVEEPTSLPPEAVLWGIWGSRATDLWAVGGTDTPGGPRGVVLRSAGDGTWTRVRDPALPLEDPADEFAGLNLYKVWGAGPDAVYLVGEGGFAVRWNGSEFKRLETGVRDILFTVHGQPGGPVLAVGGLSSGVVVRLDGPAPNVEAMPASPALNGIFVRPDGTAIATGAQGVVLERDTEGRWQRLRAPTDDNALARRTLHAVVVTGDETWVVGGDLSALTDGVVATSRRPLPTWGTP